jgi:hypothetical protein
MKLKKKQKIKKNKRGKKPFKAATFNMSAPCVRQVSSKTNS